MKILLTGAYQYQEEQINAIAKLGFDILMVEREDAQILPDFYSVDAVVCNWLFAHTDVKNFPNLRFIQLTSAGLDRIPLEYLRSMGIIVKNAKGVYSIPMAEFAIGGVLQLYKYSPIFYQQKNNKQWIKQRKCREIFGKRVLIVGAGSVGSEVAKRFRSFTEEVYGLDLSPIDNCYFKHVAPISMLDKEISICDILVITLPLTEKTRNIINANRINSMKDGSVLVNIARGGLVDEKALLNALNRNLFGAVLDVFEEEPLSSNNALWNLENVIISPHNSFVSDGNNSRLWACIYNNLKEFIQNA